MSGRSIPALLVALLLGGTTACGAGPAGEPATSPSPKAHRTIVVPTPDPLPRGVHLSFIQQRHRRGHRAEPGARRSTATTGPCTSVRSASTGRATRCACTASTTTCPASRSSTSATSCPAPTARSPRARAPIHARRRDPGPHHPAADGRRRPRGSSTGSGAPSAPPAGSQRAVVRPLRRHLDARGHRSTQRAARHARASRAREGDEDRSRSTRSRGRCSSTWHLPGDDHARPGDQHRAAVPVDVGTEGAATSTRAARAPRRSSSGSCFRLGDGEPRGARLSSPRGGQQAPAAAFLDFACGDIASH